MKEFNLGAIAGQKSDFKVCENCNIWNWHERDECHSCSQTKFRPLTEEDLDKEYEFWTEHMDYSIAGARDNVLKVV